MAFSRKAVMRICIICVFVIVFSAFASFSGMTFVLADKNDSAENDSGLQYNQRCDMCLPPDTEKSGSDSQIFERHISAADLVRANTGLPVSAGLVSESDCLMYTVRITDTSVYGYDLRCGTVMRC